MAALTGGKPIKTRAGEQRFYGLKAAARVYAGAIAVLTASGVAQAAATGTGLKCVGYFEADADNSAGADNALTALVRQGVVQCVNSASTDAITAADVNNVAYLVDDQTVARTNGGGTRSAAGRIVEVGADGVWVALGEPAMPTT
jgi:hypothetical protein